MSITSSNNLAVNNSLTVNSNTILGNDNTSTLIVNSKPTFNSDVTISGNIDQTNGTFSTGSGNITLNGDVVISGTKKLTTGTGITTVNGTSQFNNNIYIASNKNIYITDGTNFLRLVHSGTQGFFDYTGNMIFRLNSATTTFKIDGITNQGTFYYNLNTTGITNSTNAIINNSTLNQVGSASFNALSATSINNSGSYNAINCTSINNSGSYNAINCTSINNSGSYNAINCTSINNSGTLSTKNIEISDSSFSYIDMKTTTGNSDFDVRIGTNNGSSVTSGQGTLTINAANTVITSPLTANSGTFAGITNNTNALTNNGVLNQNNSSNFSTYINAPGIKSNSAAFYSGSGNNFDTSAITNPKITNGIATGNADGSSYSQFNLAINSWQGVGFVYANGADSTCKLVIDNRTGNLSTLGTINCASMSYSSTSLNYTTLPTFTSSMVGYQTTLYPLGSAANFTSGNNYSNVFSFTLPIGVWNVQMVLIIVGSTANFTIIKGKFALTNSSSVVIYQENMPQQYIPVDPVSYKNFSFITQNTSSTTVTLSYVDQAYTSSAANPFQITGTTTINPSYITLTRIA